MVFSMKTAHIYSQYSKVSVQSQIGSSFMVSSQSSLLLKLDFLGSKMDSSSLFSQKDLVVLYISILWIHIVTCNNHSVSDVIRSLVAEFSINDLGRSITASAFK